MIQVQTAGLKTEEPESAIGIICFGDNGAGKTYLCGSASQDPRLQPGIVITTEHGGYETLNYFFPGCEYIRLERPNLYDKMNEIISFLKKKQPKFIAVDSLSNLSNEFVIELCEQDGHKLRPEISHWQQQGFALEGFFSNLKLLPGLKILFVTALQDEEIDKRGDVKAIKPLLQGVKFSKYLYGIFEVICKLSCETTMFGGKPKVERSLLYSYVPKTLVRNRLGINGKIDNPTMQKIWDEILKARKERVQKS